MALYGSLGLTGKGHGSDKAVLLGLAGEKPARVDADAVTSGWRPWREPARCRLHGSHEIPFDIGEDLVFERRLSLPDHPNGMRFTASESGETCGSRPTTRSAAASSSTRQAAGAGPDQKGRQTVLPYPFTTGAELLAQRQERAADLRPHAGERAGAGGRQPNRSAACLTIWQAMRDCVERGCTQGGRAARRPQGAAPRAPALPAAHRRADDDDPLPAMDWVNLYALAVNEENAAGGRVVTAPTNGAAGIIPAVLHYYDALRARRPTRRGSRASCSPRRRSASSTRRTPRSPAPRSAARARSASPARWRPAGSPR